MSTPLPLAAPAPPPGPPIPTHWTPEQALAVFECLHALRLALWKQYGSQVQQAWREQLITDGPLPEFDPDELF